MLRARRPAGCAFLGCGTMSQSDKLRLSEKIAYGFGDLGSCLYWASFSNFLLIFYTDVFGIEGAVVGTIFLWSRIWDGVNDPLIGALADRTKTRWGKFRPYLLWLCVPFALAGVLAFTTPNLDAAGRVIWAWVTYNLVMMLYTAINIPYTALLGVISPDSLERTHVSSIKFLFAFGAGVIVKASLPWLTKVLGAGVPARGWQLTFVVYGIAAVAFFLVTFWGTKERVTPPPAQKTDLGRDLLDVVTNVPWLLLLATTLPFILFVATRSTITAHYIKYYVGEQTLTLPFLGTRVYGYEELMSSFGVIGDVAAIPGVLLVTWFARVVGKKLAFSILFGVAIVMTAAFYVLAPHQVGWMFLLQIIGSATGAPLSVLLWAMYADTADFAEWKRGRRATGLVFSASTMSQKMGWAVGGFLAGKMLTSTGFVANAIQAPEALEGIKSMMSLYPAAAGVVALVIFMIYPLGENKVAEIERDLRQRREGQSA